MKVVIACDSFKGSMSSLTAGNIIKDAVLAVKPEAEVCVTPFADGGEGTAEALIDALGGKMIECEVSDPRGRTITASYGLTSNNIAVIDSASSAGIALLESDELDPNECTTYGVGQMIDNAIRRGCREFIIGLGGSATNDAGTGMLEALGVRFFDRFGNRIKDVRGKNAGDIKHIDLSEGNRHIPECRFRVANDVNNPLCGKEGASAVFGPQKGLSEQDINKFDLAFSDLADLVKRDFKKDTKSVPGAGAAGGLGWAFITFLGAELQLGSHIVADAVELEKKLEGADIFVTGEGRIDFQTAMGKAPCESAGMAKKAGAKVIAFCGQAGKDACVVNDNNIDAFFPVLRSVCTAEEAMNAENAKQNLYDTALQVFRLL